MENKITEAWRLYEKGRTYNNQLIPNQYRVVDTNTEFYTGNQWVNCGDCGNLPKPVFNILKRITDLFIASLTSSNITVRLEPLAYADGSGETDPDADATSVANAEVKNLFEKHRYDYRVREALQNGAVTGDYCAHFWFDPDATPFGGGNMGGRYAQYKGEIKMELVDGINVMFGNPNCRDVEKQPYIIIVGRDTVENLRNEAERFRQIKDIYQSGTANTEKDPDIKPDSDFFGFAGTGGKTELQPDDETGKALYVLLYTKRTTEENAVDVDGNTITETETDADGNPVIERDAGGSPVLDPITGGPAFRRKPVKRLVTTVHVTKATKNAVIYEDVNTGLSRYPVAWGNWEKQKNQYHGRSLITGLIPNQIFINRMFAMVMAHMMNHAFPKVVFNKDLLPRWDPTPGKAIGVSGMLPGTSIGQIAAPLPVAEMSGQIFAVIDKAMQYTKECLGATDTQLGNVKPDNTSAIMVLQTNAEVPLENFRSGIKEWTEDVTNILLDFMGTYYGERPVIVQKSFQELVMQNGIPQIDPMTGQMRTQEVSRNVVIMFDFSILKDMEKRLSVIAGDTTYFSEIAITQTLDNLRQDGTLDVIQYLERIPDSLIPRKDELLAELRQRTAAGQQANAAAGAAMPLPGSPMGGGPVQGGEITEEQMVQSLPPTMSNRYDDLPQKGKNALMRNATMNG